MNNVFNSNFLCYRTYFKHINISFGNVYFSNLPSKVLIVIAITKKKRIDIFLISVFRQFFLHTEERMESFCFLSNFSSL